MRMVFTGKLEETRKEIEANCKNAGIQMDKAVSYNTDVLFVGVRAQHFIDEGMKLSSKEIAAREKGVDIQYITSIDEIAEYFI